MLPYTGSSAYCYANSLHMALYGAGMPPNRLPSPGMLECLTTMPFGFLAFDHGTHKMLFPNNPEADPDRGLGLALGFLGWACDEDHGGDPDLAIERLRRAVAEGPVLVGPLDMGHLDYIPGHQDAAGIDHFAVVISMDSEQVILHDPEGYPFATLPIASFLTAWRAEHIDYGRKLMMRSRFRQVDDPDTKQVIEHALPVIRRGIQASMNGPVTFGGQAALLLAINDLHSESPQSVGNLPFFVLPLGARRSMDGSIFLREAGLDRAADLMARRAMLLGEAQISAVRKAWPEVAVIFERIAENESDLSAAL
jgi:hypothetical protein